MGWHTAGGAPACGINAALSRCPDAPGFQTAHPVTWARALHPGIPRDSRLVGAVTTRSGVCGTSEDGCGSPPLTSSRRRTYIRHSCNQVPPNFLPSRILWVRKVWLSRVAVTYVCATATLKA